MSLIFTSLYYQEQLLILLRFFYQSIAFVSSCLHFIYVLSFYRCICGLALSSNVCLVQRTSQTCCFTLVPWNGILLSSKNLFFFFLQGKEVPAPAVLVHPLFSPNSSQAVPKISFIVFTLKPLISVFNTKCY